MRFLGICQRPVDVEDHCPDPHENTRLARKSSPSMVMSSSRVSSRSGLANSRLAWRSRARSSALRIERAFAKCGCACAAGCTRAEPSRPSAQPVLHGAEHALRDLLELLGAVVGKVQVMGDARGEPGIRAEEGLHAIAVAGEDHDQILALVLHDLQQDFDRFLPVIALVLGTIQIIGLVDEQHAAHGLLQHLLGLRSGMADVLPDEIVARHRHTWPLRT